MRIISKEVTVVIDLHEIWDKIEDIEQLKKLLAILGYSYKDSSILLDSFGTILGSDIVVEEGELHYHLELKG